MAGAALLLSVSLRTISPPPLPPRRLSSPRLLPLNFAVLEDGTICTSRWKIAKTYGRTWLPVDLLASLPLEWFLEGISFKEP